MRKALLWRGYHATVYLGAVVIFAMSFLLMAWAYAVLAAPMVPTAGPNVAEEGHGPMVGGKGNTKWKW